MTLRSFFRANRNAERDISAMAKASRDSKAAEVQTVAKDIAPVLTGTYRRSLVLKSDDTESRVVADVDYGLFVEARDNVLARALAARRE